MSKKVSQGHIIRQLQERAKELNCLYEVQEVLNNEEKDTEDILHGIAEIIPAGFQYPDVCSVKIGYKNFVYHSSNFTETAWVLSSNIIVQDELVGDISVYYTEEKPLSFVGPFLKEDIFVLINHC